MNDDSEVLQFVSSQSVAWEGYGRWQKSDLGSREWGANTVHYSSSTYKLRLRLRTLNSTVTAVTIPYLTVQYIQ